MTTTDDARKPLLIDLPAEDSDEAGPWFDLQLGEQQLRARRPKTAMFMLAMGVFSDRYADDGAQARAVFDFLEAAMDHPSYRHVIGRLKDRNDTLGTAGLRAIFEGIIEEILRLEPDLAGDPDEQRPTGRAARRAAPRRG